MSRNLASEFARILIESNSKETRNFIEYITKYRLANEGFTIIMNNADKKEFKSKYQYSVYIFPQLVEREGCHLQSLQLYKTSELRTVQGRSTALAGAGWPGRPGGAELS